MDVAEKIKILWRRLWLSFYMEKWTSPVGRTGKGLQHEHSLRGDQKSPIK
jgi:hypothetical protein